MTSDMAIVFMFFSPPQPPLRVPEPAVEVSKLTRTKSRGYVVSSRTTSRDKVPGQATSAAETLK